MGHAEPEVKSKACTARGPVQAKASIHKIHWMAENGACSSRAKACRGSPSATSCTMESFIHLQQGTKGEDSTQQLHAPQAHPMQGVGQHLSVLTPSAPHMRLMRLILYMWSAMLSEPLTLHRTQPVLFVICSMRIISAFDCICR